MSAPNNAGSSSSASGAVIKFGEVSVGVPEGSQLPRGSGSSGVSDGCIAQIAIQGEVRQGTRL